MALYEIPLTNDPDQTLAVTVPIGGVNINLRLRVRFNTQANYWWMTVADIKGNVLADAIPLLSGGDILGQFQYLGLGSAYVVNMGNSIMDSPDSTNLGTDFRLWWGDPIE
jgi:hypothetical protein